MARQMKSFRFSEDYAYDLKNIAQALDMTETAALELCIEWFYQSGAKDALQNIHRNLSPEKSLNRTVQSACKDGEISCTVRAKTWQA